MTALEVKAMREKHLDLTQEEFAKLLGVSQPAVARWENGDLPVAESHERTLRTLEQVPNYRAKSKRWLTYLAAGAATAAFLYLVFGTKED